MNGRRLRAAGGARRGQALVEFSLAIVTFLVILMGIFDLGRAVFMYNGVSEAARDIARRTAVYPYSGIGGSNYLGSSLETQGVISTQRGLVPGLVPLSMGSPDFECVDIAGNPSTNNTCGSGDAQDYVRVTVKAVYSPVTPLVSLAGPITLSSTSTVAVP
jgi:Flp pilus assembly protein TadG